MGLGDADDGAILKYAAEEGRVVLTRNYADFARLVDAMNRERREFPGVLFLSDAIPDSDGGAHVRAVQAWLEKNGDTNPVQNTLGWLPPG